MVYVIVRVGAFVFVFFFCCKCISIASLFGGILHISLTATMGDVERSRGFCGAEFSDAGTSLTAMCTQPGMQYFCASPEVCPTTSRPHLQFFIYFANAKTLGQAMKWVKKKLGFTRPVTIARGTPAENRTYCGAEEYVRDGKTKAANPAFFEHGDCPMQGKRVDLIALKDKVLSGAETVDDIAVDEPMAVHLYGRTLDRLEDIRLRKVVRTEMTKGVWLWGPTGTGKTHRAHEYGGSKYWWVNDNGWWDGYRGEDVVILNDFRGAIPYGELLQMVDKWPYNVRRRGREPMPFTSGTVVVTSALHPSDVYKNLAMTDLMTQLERRFEIIKMEKKWKNDTEEK